MSRWTGTDTGTCPKCGSTTYAFCDCFRDWCKGCEQKCPKCNWKSSDTRREREGVPL